MPTPTSTKPNVFIIESLRFADEEKKYYEGEIISNILNFADIEHQYHYVRTRAEFVHFVDQFNNSGYRYLHISCHGSKNSIATTLETLSFEDLSFILQNSIDHKRIFLSACSSVNTRLADNLFGITDCYSLIGPNKKIAMDDAAVFWASFYHLMFKHSKKHMKKEILKPTIECLSLVHKLPMKYYSSSSKAKKGWKEIILQNKVNLFSGNEDLVE